MGRRPKRPGVRMEVVVSVRMSRDTHRRLVEAAGGERRGLSDWVRGVLIRAVRMAGK